MENNSLLQTQLKLYEEDFKHEKKIKESLLEETSTLNMDLQKQIEFNAQLQQENSRLKSQILCRGESTDQNQSGASELIPPVMSTLICPKCDCTFRDLQSLEQHVARCLNFD